MHGIELIPFEHKPPKGGFFVEQMNEVKNMNKELGCLGQAKNALDKQEPLIENGTEYKAIVGYKNDGSLMDRGVYYFYEADDKQTRKQVLVQDTLSNLIFVRGIVIENGKIIKLLGFSKLHGEELAGVVRDFFGAFNHCYLYKEVSKT